MTVTPNLTGQWLSRKQSLAVATKSFLTHYTHLVWYLQVSNYLQKIKKLAERTIDVINKALPVLRKVSRTA